MSEKTFVARSGKYGRVQITLPVQTKKKMLAWMNKSGLKRAEFFRTALLFGATYLAENYFLDNEKELAQPDRT